jgi:23S rRNA pseudouridine2605 synthase
MKQPKKTKAPYSSFNKPPVVETKTEDLNPNPRLNKYVAASGLCSRRKADELIAAGFVAVNGTTITEMGYRVQENDVVTYKGDVLKPERDYVYVLLNKPKNYITTAADEKGRHTVLELIQDAAPGKRLYPVGRLDRNTTGLLLLTNDGDLAQKLSHPSHEVRKVYLATLDKPLSEAHLAQIKKGLTLDDGPAPVDNVAIVEQGNNLEVGIELHIGRNRIVRRIFEHLGYEVVKLDRMAYGPLTKKNLPRGEWRMLTEKELVLLKHFKT